MRFVLEMRQAGVTDARVLAAIERTPREHYAPEHLQALALDDVALPLAHGQTMTRPSLVGRMLMALAPRSGDVVLEIGAGSGFQAAAIAALARQSGDARSLTAIWSAKRARDLRARGLMQCVRALRRWRSKAGPTMRPTTASSSMSRLADFLLPLLDQLAPDGVLVAPVGEAEGQRLIRYRNGEREDLGAVKFEPIERGIAQRGTANALGCAVRGAFP